MIFNWYYTYTTNDCAYTNYYSVYSYSETKEVNGTIVKRTFLDSETYDYIDVYKTRKGNGTGSATGIMTMNKVD